MGRRSVTGRVLVKGKQVGFESSLEKDFLIRADMDPTVAMVLEQPVTISYQDEKGRSTRYTPDYLVTSLNGTKTLHEIKFAAEVVKERLRFKLRFATCRAFAHAHGMRFKLTTDLQIRKPDLAALSFLRRFINLPADQACEVVLLDAISQIGTTTPQGLLEASFDDVAARRAAIPSLWRMVAMGCIATDLFSPLSMASVISAREASNG